MDAFEKRGASRTCKDRGQAFATSSVACGYGMSGCERGRARGKAVIVGGGKAWLLVVKDAVLGCW